MTDESSTIQNGFFGMISSLRVISPVANAESSENELLLKNAAPKVKTPESMLDNTRMNAESMLHHNNARVTTQEDYSYTIPGNCVPKNLPKNSKTRIFFLVGGEHAIEETYWETRNDTGPRSTGRIRKTNDARFNREFVEVIYLVPGSEEARVLRYNELLREKGEAVDFPPERTVVVDDGVWHQELGSIIIGDRKQPCGMGKLRNCFSSDKMVKFLGQKEFSATIFRAQKYLTRKNRKITKFRHFLSNFDKCFRQKYRQKNFVIFDVRVIIRYFSLYQYSKRKTTQQPKTKQNLLRTECLLETFSVRQISSLNGRWCIFMVMKTVFYVCQAAVYVAGCVDSLIIDHGSTPQHVQ